MNVQKVDFHLVETRVLFRCVIWIFSQENVLLLTRVLLLLRNCMLVQMRFSVVLSVCFCCCCIREIFAVKSKK